MNTLPLFRVHFVLRIVTIAIIALLFTSSCSSTPQNSDFFAGSYLDRAQTQEENGIRVTAAVPSAEESKEIFRSPLYRRKVQPVWLKIENNRDEFVSFLPVGLDPAYYTPIEAANLDLKDQKISDRRSSANRLFFKAGMGNTVPPGEQRSGFIFSQLDEGTKSFNVDVIGASGLSAFTFFIPVPGLRLDHQNVDWKNLYPPATVRDLSTDELIEQIEAQPCCVTDKKGEGSGDPINLVLIGNPEDIYYAFIRAGWDETETIYKGSSWKTITSFIGGSEYRYSPISALYVFGRGQDVAFQKARENINERNHLRLWLAPYRYEGIPVWLGQISRDIGVRFTKKTITTHKIDPDVDETREYLLENLAYAQALARIAYLGGVDAASLDQPRGNLTGDPYFTDGYRLVLWVSSQPVDIAEIEVEVWRIPPDRQSTP